MNSDYYGRLCYISIHALLAESDANVSGNSKMHINFYPRSPCGERLAILAYLILFMLFLSTLSLRRATHAIFYRYRMSEFLSTLSLRRATAIGK